MALRVTVSVWLREPCEILGGLVVFRSPMWGLVQLAACSLEALWD